MVTPRQTRGRATLATTLVILVTLTTSPRASAQATTLPSPLRPKPRATQKTTTQPLQKRLRAGTLGLTFGGFALTVPGLTLFVLGAIAMNHPPTDGPAENITGVILLPVGATLLGIGAPLLAAAITRGSLAAKPDNRRPAAIAGGVLVGCGLAMAGGGSALFSTRSTTHAGGAVVAAGGVLTAIGAAVLGESYRTSRISRRHRPTTAPVHRSRVSERLHRTLPPSIWMAVAHMPL